MKHILGNSDFIQFKQGKTSIFNIIDQNNVDHNKFYSSKLREL